MRVTPENLLADLLSRLDEVCREAFEERAGIMEFDAGLNRAHAEALALLDVIRLHPLCLSGITVLHVELNGVTEWLLTADPVFARQYLADIAGKEIGVVTLSDVLNEHCCGIATLAPLAVSPQRKCQQLI